MPNRNLAEELMAMQHHLKQSTSMSNLIEHHMELQPIKQLDLTSMPLTQFILTISPYELKHADLQQT